MGATASVSHLIISQPGSIHAPVMGAKQLNRLTAALTYGFNPRTRDGCEYSEGVMLKIPDVSIHAPVMGANCCV